MNGTNEMRAADTPEKRLELMRTMFLFYVGMANGLEAEMYMIGQGAEPDYKIIRAMKKSAELFEKNTMIFRDLIENMIKSLGYGNPVISISNDLDYDATYRVLPQCAETLHVQHMLVSTIRIYMIAITHAERGEFELLEKLYNVLFLGAVIVEEMPELIDEAGTAVIDWGARVKDVAEHCKLYYSYDAN